MGNLNMGNLWSVHYVLLIVFFCSDFQFVVKLSTLFHQSGKKLFFCVDKLGNSYAD